MKRRISRLIRHLAVRLFRMPLVARLMYERADECGVPDASALYRCSLRHDLAHNTRYVLMFASGCLFWWPKAGADHLPRRLSCRGRMTLVFAGLPFELFVVIALMSYGKPVRSSGMMFLSVFVLITLAAALVRHRQRGTAADRQAGAG